MHLILAKDYDALSEKTATLMIDFIKTTPNATVCLTSGDTPNGVYRALVKRIKEENLNIDNCFFVGLDEWVGLDRFDDGSCGSSVFREFIAPLGIPINQYHFFDGKAENLALECQKMDAIIAAKGGIDLMLVGLGTNGHIGLNEPGYSWKLRSHVSDLEEVTKTVGQKYFKNSTILSQGITLGLQYFQDAKLAILIANGPNKAEAVKTAITAEASEDFPATIVQTLGNAIVVVDEAAARGLRD